MRVIYDGLKVIIKGEEQIKYLIVMQHRLIYIPWVYNIILDCNIISRRFQIIYDTHCFYGYRSFRSPYVI